jgi:hypothetical protein
VSKISSFDGDLDDHEQVRAKLADVEERIAESERVLRRVEDDLMRLERLREGLLVIVGDKETESEAARAARMAKIQQQAEIHRKNRELRESAKSIQAQVENLVNALGRHVTANDLLAHLPPDTKRETVNWALWHAHTNNRILKISHGSYAPLREFWK